MVETIMLFFAVALAKIRFTNAITTWEKATIDSNPSLFNYCFSIKQILHIQCLSGWCAYDCVCMLKSLSLPH